MHLPTQMLLRWRWAIFAVFILTAVSVFLATFAINGDRFSPNFYSTRSDVNVQQYPDCSKEDCSFYDLSDSTTRALYAELQELMNTKSCSIPIQADSIFTRIDLGFGAAIDHYVAMLGRAINYRRRPMWTLEPAWSYGMVDNCTLGMACYFNMSFYKPCEVEPHSGRTPIGPLTYPAQPYESLRGQLWVWLAFMKTFWKPNDEIIQMIAKEKERIKWEWPTITIMVRRGSTMDAHISKIKSQELHIMPPWALRERIKRNFSFEYGFEPYLEEAIKIRRRHKINRIHLVTDDVPVYEDVLAGKYDHTGFRFSVQSREEVAANYLNRGQPGTQVIRNAEILSDGAYFISTFSSCYARLVYQIMLLKGRANEVAISLDTPWYSVLTDMQFGAWPTGAWAVV